jgi:hypothetical protein
MKTRTQGAQSSSTKTEHAAASQAQPVSLGARFGNWSLRRLLQTQLLQAKLTISGPADPLEQEADRLARDGAVSESPGNRPLDASALTVQRACNRCDEELQRKPLQEQPLQVSRAQADTQGAPAVDSAFEQKIRSLPNRGGQSLPQSVQPFVQRLGVNADAVRLHMDADLAGEAGAKAFTVGNQIVFNPTHFAPGTQRGDELIRHECVHVAQQGAAPGSAMIQRQPADGSMDRLPTPDRFAREMGPRAHDIILENVGSDTSIDGTPLSASEWRERLRQPGAHPQRAVRFASSLEVLNDDKLLNWAMNQPGTAEQIVWQVERGGAFTGPSDARARFATKLKGDLRALPLDKRREQREAQRVEQANNVKKAAEERKAKTQRAQALAAADHRSEVSSAMEALTGSGRGPAMQAIYADVHALKGSQDDLLNAYKRHGELKARAARAYDTGYGHRMDWLRVDFRSDLEASIESRLRPYGLSRAEFDARVRRFEAAFRQAMVDLAHASLDRAKEICAEQLDEPGKLDATARAMFASLSPVRKPVIGALDSADTLRHAAMVLSIGEAQMEGAYNPEISSFKVREEAREVRALGLGLAGYALQHFPFFAWPDFPREDVVRAETPEEVSRLLSRYFQQHISAIEEAREQIGDPRRMYQFDTLIEAVMGQLHIPPGSIFRQIIDDERERAGSMSLTDKIKAVLVFALIATSVIVPAAAPLAATAMAGIGIHGALEAIQSYREDQAAFQTGLKSVEPSVFWVVVALVGAGLDVQGVLHVVKTTAVLNYARRFALKPDALELRALSSELRHIPESELDPVFRDAIERAAERRVVPTSASASDAEGGQHLSRPRPQGEQPVGVRVREPAEPVHPSPPRQVPHQQQTQQQQMAAAGGGGRKTPPDGVASNARRIRDEQRRKMPRGSIERSGGQKPEELPGGVVHGEIGKTPPTSDDAVPHHIEDAPDTQPGIHPDLDPKPPTPPPPSPRPPASIPPAPSKPVPPKPVPPRPAPPRPAPPKSEPPKPTRSEVPRTPPKADAQPPPMRQRPVQQGHQIPGQRVHNTPMQNPSVQAGPSHHQRQVGQQQQLSPPSEPPRVPPRAPSAEVDTDPTLVDAPPGPTRARPPVRPALPGGEPTIEGVLPAIRYIDPDDPSLVRVITVRNGRAYYQSTSGDRKIAGEFYPFYGSDETPKHLLLIQETAEQSGHFWVTPGHLIKYDLMEPTGRLAAVPELRNFALEIGAETRSPQAINAWLREHGVERVFTSLEDYVTSGGFRAQAFR